MELSPPLFFFVSRRMKAGAGRKGPRLSSPVNYVSVDHNSNRIRIEEEGGAPKEGCITPPGKSVRHSEYFGGTFSENFLFLRFGGNEHVKFLSTPDYFSFVFPPSFPRFLRRRK